MAAKAGEVLIDIRARTAQLQQDMQQVVRITRQGAGEVASLANGARVALAAIGLGAGVSGLAAQVDEYIKYTAQLKLATNSTREFAVANDDVVRIAAVSHASISGVGTLYGRVSQATADMSVSQKRLAQIVEVVNLALKVSGASAVESASAQLQLSQAFSAGALRGEEFNAVSEAAPRLMRALADGMGVPVGALKKMATEGLITSEVMATVLPQSLGKLRVEAQQIQTIGGALTLLKNKTLEYVGTTADASGSVRVLSGGIGLLANNLDVLIGLVGTAATAKLATFLTGAATSAYQSAAANRALVVSHVATAESNAVAAAAALATTNARVAEIRASIAASEANVALALVTNALNPAQARAALAATAHAEALAALTVAQRSASVSAGVAAGALGLLGGPVGAVVTVLGLAATAWAVFGRSSEDASKQAASAASAARESTGEILQTLDRQIERLSERNRIQKFGIVPIKSESPATVRLGEVVRELDDVGHRRGEYAAFGDDARIAKLKALGREYGELKGKIDEFNRVSEESDRLKDAKSYGAWMTQYATKSEQMRAEIEKARKQLGDAFTPELEARIRQHYETKDKGAAQELRASQSLIAAAQARQAETAREAAGLAPYTEGQKLQIELTEKLASGKLKLAPASIAALEADYRQIDTNIRVAETIKTANAGRDAAAKIMADYTAAQDAGIDAAKRELDQYQSLVRHFGLSKTAIEALELARLEEQLAQRASLGLTLDEINGLQRLISVKQQSAQAAGQLDALEAQKRAAEETRREIDKIDKAAGDVFVRFFSSGKDAFNGLRDELKNGLLRLLYEATIRPWVISIAPQFGGGGVVGGLAGLLGGGSSGGTGAFSVGNLINAGQTIYSGFSGALTSNIGSLVSGFGNLIGSAQISAFGTGIGLSAGQASAAATAYQSAGLAQTGGAINAGAGFASYIPVVGQIVALVLANQKLYAAGYRTENGLSGDVPGQTIANYGVPSITEDAILRLIGVSGKTASLLTGSSIAAALIGRKTPEVTNATIKGTYDQAGFIGSQVVDYLSKGGLFRRDKRGTVITPLDGDANRSLSQSFDALRVAATSAAAVLGVPASTISAYRTEVNIALSKNGDKAADAAALQAELIRVSDGISSALVPALSSLAKAGEAPTVTLQRLAAEMTATEAIFAQLGRSFGQAGVESIAARERFVGHFDGENTAEKTASAASAAAFFAQNFVPERERFEAQRRALHDQLTALGVPIITTTEQFRRLVQATDVTTDAGAKQVAGLLKLSQSYLAVTEYSERLAAVQAAAAADQAAELADQQRTQRQLDIALLRETGQAEAALRAERADTVAALATEQQRVTQVAIYAAQDAAQIAAAQQRVQQEAQAAAQAAQQRAQQEAQAAAQAAQQRAQAAQQRAQQEAQAAAQSAQQRLDGARGAVTQAYQRDADRLRGVIESARALSARLRDQSAAVLVGDNSYLSSRQRLVAAQQAFSAAKPDDKINSGQTVVQLAKAAGLVGADYARVVAQVRTALEHQADASDAQLEVAQAQLGALDSAVNGIVKLDTTVQTLRDALTDFAAAGVAASRASSAAAVPDGVSLGGGRYLAGGRIVHYADAVPAVPAFPIPVPVVSGPVVTQPGPALATGADQLVGKLDAILTALNALLNAQNNILGVLTRITRNGNTVHTEVG